MIPLEEVLRILDEVRGEAIEIIETPRDDKRDAFEFGRAHGFMQCISQLRERINAAQEQQDGR